MAEKLKIIYGILIFANVVLLALNVIIRKKGLWVVLYVYEAICLAAAMSTMFYFNSLPGTGMAPGLAYWGETINSLLACVGFLALFVVSLVLWLILRNRARRNAVVNRE